MTKKKMLHIVVVSVTILVFVIIVICGFDGRHFYMPSRRVVLSDSIGAIRVRPPSMEANIAASDLIAVVKVVDSGMEIEGTLQNPETTPEKFLVPIVSTIYTFEIQNVWYGEAKSKEITVRIRGGRDTQVTKPRQNDELIVFLVERDPAKFDFDYILADDEHSMFAVNPLTNTLYAFSDLDEFTIFDGKKPELLNRAIMQAAKNVYGGSDKLEAWENNFVPIDEIS